MEFSSFALQQAEKLGESAKIAADLAMLLDHDILSAKTIAAQKFGAARLAVMRLEVLDDFCALCSRQGIPVPELEPEILALCQPRRPAKDEAAAIRGLVKDARSRLGRRRPKADARRDLLAVARCLELMPGLVGGKDSLAAFRSALNSRLLELGSPTVRPDFSGLVVPNAAGCLPAPRPLTALVVDDDISEIVRTLRALAGWPGLMFGIMRFAPEGDRWNCPPEKKAEILGEATATVLKARPDIVIMDEGMPIVDGGELIRAIKAAQPELRIEFVGNSGGMGEALKQAGAIGNMRKGMEIEPLERAIRRFGRK